MTQVRATAERVIDAPVLRVRSVITDYPARSRWMPSEYSDVRVEADGSFAYRLTVGRRARDYRLRIEQGPDGPVEQDSNSSLRTSWQLLDTGGGTRVRLVTEWTGAGGIGGFFERTFAPRALGRVHAGTLDRLAEQCR